MPILLLLDLSAAFDTTDHGMLITVTYHFGLFYSSPGLVTSYFSCNPSVFVGHESISSALKCGVPQGLVLGPPLFTLYTQPLSTVICQSGHSNHFSAYDSKLHNSSMPSDFQAFVHSLKDCAEDVAEWMSDSKLRMNDDNAELIAVGTKSKIRQRPLALPLRPSLAMTCHSLSLLIILVSIQMKLSLSLTTFFL